jgi:hypothetical protein
MSETRQFSEVCLARLPGLIRPTHRSSVELLCVSRRQSTASLAVTGDMLHCPHCDRPIFDKIVPAHAGSIGGRKVAKERGPDFFRKLQAKRKHKWGGRPKKANNP